MKKYIFISLLFVFLFSNYRAQNCNFSSLNIGGFDGQILYFGDFINDDTLSICSGTSIELSPDQTMSQIIDWKINGVIQSSNIGISETLINHSNNDLIIDYIMLFEFNADCWTDTLVVKIHPFPSISVTHKDLLCFPISQSSGDGQIFIESNSPIYSTSYIGGWNTSFMSYSNDNTNYDTIKYLLAANDYGVFITDTNYCNSDTVLNIVIKSPEELKVDTAIIINDNCGQGTGSVEFHIVGGTAPYTYQLSYGQTGPIFLSTQDSIIHNLEGNNINTITNYYSIRDANNCYFTVPTDFNSMPTNYFTIAIGDEDYPPSPDFDSPISYCSNDSAVLQEHEQENHTHPHFYYFNGLNDSTYIQDDHFTVTPDQLASYESVTIFALGGENQENEGCRSEDSILVLFEKSLNCFNLDSVPDITTNSFSPNDPLHPENNTFIIDLDYINNPNIKDVKVTIYNRWGDIVFIRENYDNSLNSWHGDNMQGEAVSEGTYFYTIEIPSINYTTSNWVYLDLK